MRSLRETIYVFFLVVALILLSVFSIHTYQRENNFSGPDIKSSVVSVAINKLGTFFVSLSQTPFLKLGSTPKIDNNYAATEVKIFNSSKNKDSNISEISTKNQEKVKNLSASLASKNGLINYFVTWWKKLKTEMSGNGWSRL